MKNLTSKLMKEDIEFVKDLAKELETQDTRGTAQPCVYVITQEVIHTVPEGYSDELMCYWQESEYFEEDWNQFKEDLINYYGEDEINELSVSHILEMNSFADLKDSVEAEDIEAVVVYIERKQEPLLSRFNIFLTEKAAKEYIEKDRHNLKKPRIWVEYLWKNKEISQLAKVITLLAKELD